MTELAPVMGTAEVCALVGVSRAGLKKIRDRGDFPDPLAQLKAGPVWDGDTIREWVAARRRSLRTQAGGRTP